MAIGNASRVRRLDPTVLVMNRSRSRSSARLVRGNLLYSACEAMEPPDPIAVPEFAIHSFLKSPTVVIRDAERQGNCRAMSAEEWTATTQLIFPYRGVYEHFASSVLLSTSAPKSRDRHAQEEA